MYTVHYAVCMYGSRQRHSVQTQQRHSHSVQTQQREWDEWDEPSSWDAVGAWVDLPHLLVGVRALSVFLVGPTSQKLTLHKPWRKGIYTLLWATSGDRAS